MRSFQVAAEYSINARGRGQPAHVPRSWGGRGRAGDDSGLRPSGGWLSFSLLHPKRRCCAKRRFQYLETQNVARKTAILHCKLPSAHTLVGRAAGSADGSQGARVLSFARLQNCAIVAFHSTPHGKTPCFSALCSPETHCNEKAAHMPAAHITSRSCA